MVKLSDDQSTALRDTILSPSRFAKGILGHSLWPMQRDILEAVAARPRVAVKACHSSGKTFLAAEAALWWVTRFPDGIVVTTAPTWVQVEKLLWGEIHKDIASAKLKYPEPNKTELKLGPNRYAMGLSTNEGVRFQGFHGKILIIIDEAPGVRPDIWESIEGIRAGGDVRILALGNPVVAGGEFYDAFTTNRAGWKTFTIDAFATPNLYEPSLARHLTEAELLALPDEQLDYAPKPYLTLRRWVKEKLVEWGPDSPVYQSRVRGQFPKQSQDSLIGIADLEAANLRPAIDRGGAVCAGLDVAGPGEDETSLTLRCGDSIIRTKSWAISDPRGEVVQELLPYLERLEEVNVDSNGIGYYIALHLQDVMKEKLPARWRGVVNFVNVGEGTEEPDMYVNLKAELYWRLKMRFAKQAVSGLLDETAISQLGTIRYRINSKGKIEIESKDDMRKRGAKSPDRGESIMLAFAAIKETAATRQPVEAPLSMDRLSAWSVGSTTF